MFLSSATRIRYLEVGTSESSDCECMKMEKARKKQQTPLVPILPTTDALGIDIAFKRKHADLFEAAALIFPEKPHTVEIRGEVNIKKRLWEQIYAVMRLHPDGLSISNFTERYSQMFHKSVDYKSCGCRRLHWLLLRLPDVEVVRLPDGSPGIKLMRLPNKYQPQTYADKLSRFDQLKKSSGNSEVSDDIEDENYPDYAPEEHSNEAILSKCVECLESVSANGISIAQMVEKLKPNIMLGESELTSFLAKFGDIFEIKLGANEQFYVRLAKFSSGHVTARKNEFDAAKFLVTPASNIPLPNDESITAERQCHVFPSTSRSNAPSSDSVDETFDLRAYFHSNRFANYRISFCELESLYQSRAREFCELEDILDKIKDLLQYCVVDFTGYEVRPRRTLIVNSQIERQSSIERRIDSVTYENSLIHLLDLEVGENLEITVSLVENCDKFYVKIIGLQSQIEALRLMMNELYNSANTNDYVVPEQLLRPNYICAGKVEDTWHRVQIKEIIQRDLYSVFLLDDGRIDYVCSSNLRLLKENFVSESIPAGAAQFSLRGVRPCQSQVTSAKDRFRHLSEAAIISAQIEEKLDENKCAVTLYAYTNEGVRTMEINQSLIDEGYGVSNSTTESGIFSSEELSSAAQSGSPYELNRGIIESPAQLPATSSLNADAQPFLLSNANARNQKEIVNLNIDLDKTLTIGDFSNTTSMSVPCAAISTPYQNINFSQSYPEAIRPPIAIKPPNFGPRVFQPVLGAPLRPPVVFPVLPPNSRPNFPSDKMAPQTIFVPVYVPVPFPAPQFYPNHLPNTGPFLPPPPGFIRHPMFPNNSFHLN